MSTDTLVIVEELVPSAVLISMHNVSAAVDDFPNEIRSQTIYSGKSIDPRSILSKTVVSVYGIFQLRDTSSFMQ